jgi:protein-S-isoprenylcysteine O-methyltransferase Ste14
MSRRCRQNWLWIAPLAVLLSRVDPQPSFGGGPADELLDQFGLLVVLLGIGLRVCARGWKFEAPRGALVRDGPYGYVRHPLYLGSFLIGLGLCTMLDTFWFTLAFIACFWMSHGPVIRSEEAVMIRRWPEYAAYRQQVPALLPNSRRWRKRTPIRPHRLGLAIRREADALCLWPLVAVGLKLWEDAAVHPGPRHDPVHATVLWIVVAALLAGWFILRVPAPRA